MNDQPTTEMTDLALRILDELQVWTSLAALPVEDMPTVQHIANLWTRISALRAEDAQQAEDFATRLKQIEQDIVSRYRNEIDAGLSELTHALVADASWRSVEARVERALIQVETITGNDDSQSKKLLKDLKAKLEGETIQRKAAEDMSRTQEEIRLRLEKEIDTSTIVGDARDLWERMERYYNEAEGIGTQTSIMKDLDERVEKCKQYYDDTRRKLELAVTLDEAGEHDDALKNFEYIREKEGNDAQVYYIETELDPESGEPTEVKRMVSVGRAIQVCRERRTRFLFAKAHPHIAQVKLHLTQGNPRAADQEWKNILGIEYLPQESRKETQELRELIDNELAELARFEQAVNEASALQPSIGAWEQLMQVGARYERFQESSQRWQETRERLSERVQEAATNDLQVALRYLANLDQAALQRSLDQVAAQLADWKDEFTSVLNSVNVLRHWSESLATLLARGAQELETRQLDGAAQTLQRIQATFMATNQQLPERLAGQLVLPDEYHRLGRALDAYQKADVLHTELRREVEGTENTAKLKQLADEIRGHIERVAEKYRSDFQRLAELAEARYSYFVGKGILQVAGNYEEARRFLAAAAGHPDYRSVAMDEIAEIDKNRLPANQRVREALEKAEGHSQKGELWEAYRQTSAVRSEPAEKSLREPLKEKYERYRGRALLESKNLLTAAVSAGYGQPDLLKTHAARLQELDSQAYAQLEAQLKPLIHEMEARVAVENNRWGEAAQSYRKAAQEIEQRSGPGDRTRELRNLADAAVKEDLLLLQNLLDASVLVGELNQQVKGIFAQDPDLRSALALALVRDVEAQEVSYDETPDDLRDRNELDSMREIHRSLHEAWGESRQAINYAQQWLIGRRRPAYEQARCDLLGRSADEEAKGRVQTIKEDASVVEKARKVSRYKLEIISLLSKLTIDSPGV